MPDLNEWLSAHADRHPLCVGEFLINEDLIHETEDSLKETAQVIEKRASGEWEELPRD